MSGTDGAYDATRFKDLLARVEFLEGYPSPYKTPAMVLRACYEMSSTEALLCYAAAASTAVLRSDPFVPGTWAA
eukprot:569152-Rhodomonas_salina.1